MILEVTKLPELIRLEARSCTSNSGIKIGVTSFAAKRRCLGVLLLWRDTMITAAALIKENVSGAGYSFKGLVHYCQGGKDGSMPADMALEN